MRPTILWHTWEPGLEGNYSTSGGGATWTQYLWSKFEDAGYNILYVPLGTPPLFSYNVELAIFCWRWELPHDTRYAIRNMAYERQMELINLCIKNKTPFLIHDQDLKMHQDERNFILGNGGVIATPSFFPASDEITLHFPNPYKYLPLNVSENETLVYVGNNYERMEQAVRMLDAFSRVKNTYVYGNWLEEGPGRNPNDVQRQLPYVIFGGRLSQDRIMHVLSNSRATVMLHKEEYGPRGFTTIRWAEAASASMLPFIPSEFRLPNEYTSILQPLRVSDGIEMLNAFTQMGKEEMKQHINTVRELVNQYMTPQPWIDIIERMTA